MRLNIIIEEKLKPRKCCCFSWDIWGDSKEVGRDISIIMVWFKKLALCLIASFSLLLPSHYKFWVSMHSFTLLNINLDKL